MQDKLQELTDKIYREGITKANEEAEKILADARNNADRIVGEAEKKAKTSVEDAERKAEEIMKNANSEIKISFRHAVNTLKQDLEKTISGKIVSGKVAESFKDEGFVAELIMAIFRNWSPQGGSARLDVLLPEAQLVAVEGKLKSLAGSVLGTGIHLKPVDSVKSGFEVVPSEGGYKISATAGDLEAYLREFLRPKMVDILFEEK